MGKVGVKISIIPFKSDISKVIMEDYKCRIIRTLLNLMSWCNLLIICFFYVKTFYAAVLARNCLGSLVNVEEILKLNEKIKTTIILQG